MRKKKYNKLFIWRHITSLRNTQCPSDSNNYVHRINTERIIKEKQHLCPDISTEGNVQIAIDPQGRTHTTEWIQTKYDTLPFFRFQHNHFECVFRSSILKLETPSVTGDIGRVGFKKKKNTHTHTHTCYIPNLTPTTNTHIQTCQNAYSVEKQTRPKITV